MFEELRYRVQGWLWLSRELLSQVGARLKTQWLELETRGRAETFRRSRVSQKDRHSARIRRWASAQTSGESPGRTSRRGSG
jgi:hypothetical protein